MCNVKNNSSFLLIPHFRLASIFLFGTLLAAATVFLACAEKNFSVKLEPGMIVKSVHGEITTEQIDFVPEPGDIQEQTEYSRFLSRQDQLSRILNTYSISVIKNNIIQEYTASPRKIADLPVLFWIQVIVALGGIFISGWIWALKPKSLATTFFFVSGLAMGFTALSSAVYTTRLAAIPAPIFRSLSLLNACSAPLFGVAITSLFFIYPRKFRRWKQLIIFSSVFFVIWTLACVQQWGFEFSDINIIIVFQMALLCAALGAQFVMTKKDPKSRAVLQWLGISVLTGSGIFVAFNTIPVLLGLKPLEQGYAFLSFLLIYLGIAFGLKQYRLFEVGDWAYRFLFYTVGTAIFVALDALLVFTVGMNRVPALGLALMFVGFAYLPLRDYFWRFFSRRKELLPHELLSEALHITLAPSQAVRLQRWEGLIKKLFDPLEMTYCDSVSKTVILETDGLALTLPAVADIPALRVAYPWSGRSLFSLRAVDTAKQIIEFIEEAESSRQAYDRGVIEERLRIAQDLHDDVGARLLTGLHSDNSDLRSTIQGAMADIRSIVKGIAGEKVLLNELLADLRSESYKRLQAVDMELIWSLPEEKIFEFVIDYHLCKAITSVIREIVSNTIKHAHAKKLEVTIQVKAGQIHIASVDDGHGFPSKVFQGQTGFGLKGLNKRVTDLGGKFEFKNSPHASVTIDLPIIN